MSDQAVQTNIIDNPFADYNLVSLNRSFWSGEITAKLRPELDPATRRQIRKSYKLKKVLVNDDNPLFKAPKAEMNTFYSWLVGDPNHLGEALPFAIDGTYLLHKDKVTKVNEEFKASKVKIKQAVNALKVGYSELKEDARTKFVNLNASLFADSKIQQYFVVEYNEAEYPDYDELDSRYDMNLRIVEMLNTPSDLPPGIKAEQEEELRQMFEEAKEKCVLMLLEKFRNCVANLAERTSTPDAIVRSKSAAIDNPRTFCEQFEQTLNLHNNKELSALVNQCKASLAKVKDMQTLKNQDNLRMQVHSDMDKICNSLEGMITVSKGRKFFGE